MYEKKKIIAIACVVVAVCALLVYLIFSGTTDTGHGNDAKDAVREVQVHSKQSADAVRSARDEIKSAGEQLDRSVSRVDRAAESADRVQKRIDENSRTIAECRDLIADGRKEFDEAADIFRQVDEENRGADT